MRIAGGASIVTRARLSAAITGAGQGTAGAESYTLLSGCHSLRHPIRHEGASGLGLYLACEITSLGQRSTWAGDGRGALRSLLCSPALTAAWRNGHCSRPRYVARREWVVSTERGLPLVCGLVAAAMTCCRLWGRWRDLALSGEGACYGCCELQRVAEVRQLPMAEAPQWI